MLLVDLAQSAEIRAAMGEVTQTSGGSAANTVAAIAALGGTAGFVGVIAEDELGDVFANDLRAAGVEFHPAIAAPAETGDADADVVGTGRCHVLVSPDAERTMATHLGAANQLAPRHVTETLIARAGIVYLEGYLWDLPAAKEAMRRASEVAHDGDGAVAFSLSDPFCVSRHQREFLELLLDEIDVLFGNEEEIMGLFGATKFDDAVDAAEETGLLVAITRGAKGSVVTTPRGAAEVPAVEVAQVVDTNGAGDLYAAGFLYGLTHGAEPIECARLGALCAGEIIGHLGARPVADLQAMATAAGLFETMT
jgi:sugar/nucleoside kinase (ribokinase family)